MKKQIILLIFLIITININTIQACTAFLLKHNDTYIVGLNFDFESNQGMLMINPRGLQKTAIPFAFEKSATWISKYGSLTFNFIGREEPMEGINEKGLAIAALFFPETQLPKRDKRPMVDDMQWIQYMLDNCADINEVISELANIRISKKSKTRIHYFLSDSSGNFAIIEFIEGECKYYVNDNSTNGFICNASFDKSSKYLKQHQGWGGVIPITDAYKKKTAEDVVAMGADLIDKYDGLEKMNSYAFNILQQVEAPRNSPNYGTQWSIVFDCKNTKVYFKTLKNRETRTIDLKKLDFSCIQDFRALSIVESKPQNIYSQFDLHAPNQNMKMFKDGFKVFLKKDELPMYIDKAIERVANTPYSYNCQ